MFLCFVVLFFSFTRLRNDPQIPTVTCGDVFRIFLRNFTSPEADTLPCACCRAAAVPPCGASVSMLWLKRTYICGALVTCLCIAELFTVVCGRAAVVSVPLRVGRVVPQTHVQLNSNPERSCTVAVRLSSFSPYWTLRN